VGVKTEEQPGGPDKPVRSPVRLWRVLVAIVLAVAIFVGASTVWNSHLGRSTIADVTFWEADEFCMAGQRVQIEGATWYATPSSFPGNGHYVGDLVEASPDNAQGQLVAARFILSGSTIDLMKYRRCV
jgi:hypothetical protein